MLDNACPRAKNGNANVDASDLDYRLDTGNVAFGLDSASLPLIPVTLNDGGTTNCGPSGWQILLNRNLL